ncbi:MAG: ABC transporter ATP-binding protein [Peptococcaceae bacterium]|nr:ABC transporter ATP-binding protein [Peptococcaceae bacterium]
MNKNNILTVENLTISFGSHQAVRNLSFDLREGEILGIIGPNGAGKTTVLNALIGILKPVQGSIIYKGRDITRLSPAKRCRMGIGRTYQVPRPFVNMTVYENVLVGAVHGAVLSEKQARGRVLEILDTTRLMEKRNLPAGRLDLLDRKRLELARGMATNPDVLLLDEVAAGLTEAEVKDVINMVKKVKETGVSIIWIEHILITMLEAADRVLCIAAGRGLVCGRPREVLDSKEVEEVYLGVEED